MLVYMCNRLTTDTQPLVVIRINLIIRFSRSIRWGIKSRGVLQYEYNIIHFDMDDDDI